MGRIKTKLIKSRTRDILERHSEKFSTDFSKNKEALVGVVSVGSKKLRNAIAGYIVRIKRTQR